MFDNYLDVLKLSSKEVNDLEPEQIKSAYEKIYEFTGVINAFTMELNKYVEESIQRVNPYDLTRVETNIIMHIEDNPGVRANDMAKLWDYTPAFMSRTLRKLEDEGYIYKEIDPDNRIYFNIYLTKKSKEFTHVLKACESDLLANMIDHLLIEYSEEEVDLFFNIFSCAGRSLEKINVKEEV